MQENATPVTAPIEEEKGLGEAQQVDLVTSTKQRIAVICVNLVVLTEIFIAMYFAAQDSENLTPTFFKVFFSMLVPTIIAYIIIKRRLVPRGKA